MFRIVGELLHPIAQLRHMHAQVLRSLHIGHASLLDQAHSLKLELAGKLPSLHDPPPAPSNHLTRCLRNRVQAKQTQSIAWAVAAAECAQIMLYYKEIASLLLLGFVVSRLVLRCRNTDERNWDYSRLRDKESRLDLCL